LTFFNSTKKEEEKKRYKNDMEGKKNPGGGSASLLRGRQMRFCLESIAQLEIKKTNKKKTFAQFRPPFSDLHARLLSGALTTIFVIFFFFCRLEIW
jgi:ATP adenylyltransferase/5',5'''-P-1,P-4-tetraphosphate phosphorylase II